MPHNFLSYWIASLWRRCSGYGPWGSCSSPAPPTPARRPCGDETADYRLQLSTEGSWARWRNIRIKPNPTQVHDDQAHPVKPCVYWNNLSKTWFIRRQEFAFYGDQKVGCPPYLSLSLPSPCQEKPGKRPPKATKATLSYPSAKMRELHFYSQTQSKSDYPKWRRRKISQSTFFLKRKWECGNAGPQPNQSPIPQILVFLIGKKMPVSSHLNMGLLWTVLFG